MTAVAPAGAVVPRQSPVEAHRKQLDELLAEARRLGTSDVHLSSGLPPWLRVDNELIAAGRQALTPDDVMQIALCLMSTSQQRQFAAQQQVDLAFCSADGTRFRANIYRERGNVAIALRRLETGFRDFLALNLPPQLEELTQFPFGLVLITGPTGSGKSTTLAALIHLINTTRACHIITIEDPIEQVHASHLSLVHQRELHTDVATFADALKAALREDPDVLLVGEMRDTETMRAAITAAETGHLVFSTLHTGDVAGAVGRMIGSFPADEQPLVREQLSRVLRAVVSQRLLRKAKGAGRTPVVEIMRVNTAIANLIRLGDLRQAYSIIAAGADEGMLLLEESLARLVSAGHLAKEEALPWCRDLAVFESRLRSLSPRRGW
jgi:twitching motility protein PilT